MRSFSKTITSLLIAVGAFLLACTAYALLFISIRDKNIEISALQQGVDTSSGRAALLLSAKNALDATAKDRADLDAYFVSNDDVVSFIEDIEGLKVATGADIKVVSVNVAADSKNTSVQTLTLSTTIDGSWNQQMHALSLIESMPYRTNVSSVQFRLLSDIDRTLPKQWSGSITFSVSKAD